MTKLEHRDACLQYGHPEEYKGRMLIWWIKCDCWCHPKDELDSEHGYY